MSREINFLDIFVAICIRRKSDCRIFYSNESISSFVDSQCHQNEASEQNNLLQFPLFVICLIQIIFDEDLLANDRFVVNQSVRIDWKVNIQNI